MVRPALREDVDGVVDELEEVLELELGAHEGRAEDPRCRRRLLGPAGERVARALARKRESANVEKLAPQEAAA